MRELQKGVMMSENKGYGLLLAMLDPPESMEDEFNTWYDTEHIPERKAIPGFVTAQRFVAPEGAPKYLAIYDVHDLGVFESEAYRRVGPENYSPWTQRINKHLRIFIRELWEQVTPGDGKLSDEAGAVLVWWREASPGKKEECRRWYESRWLPGLSGANGFVQVRRFERTDAREQELDIVEFREMKSLLEHTGNLLSGAGRESLFKDIRTKAYARYHEGPGR